MQAFKWGFRCLSLLADVDNINYKLLEEENKTPNLLRYIHEICSNIYKFISESWRLLWCYHKSCQTDYDVALKKKKVFWSTWISALSKCADSLWRIKKKWLIWALISCLEILTWTSLLLCSFAVLHSVLS